MGRFANFLFNIRYMFIIGNGQCSHVVWQRSLGKKELKKLRLILPLPLKWYHYDEERVYSTFFSPQFNLKNPKFKYLLSHWKHSPTLMFTSLVCKSAIFSRSIPTRLIMIRDTEIVKSRFVTWLTKQGSYYRFSDFPLRLIDY